MSGQHMMKTRETTVSNLESRCIGGEERKNNKEKKRREKGTKKDINSKSRLRRLAYPV